MRGSKGFLVLFFSVGMLALMPATSFARSTWRAYDESVQQRLCEEDGYTWTDAGCVGDDDSRVIYGSWQSDDEGSSSDGVPNEQEHAQSETSEPARSGGGGADDDGTDQRPLEEQLAEALAAKEAEKETSFVDSFKVPFRYQQYLPGDDSPAINKKLTVLCNFYDGVYDSATGRCVDDEGNLIFTRGHNGYADFGEDNYNPSNWDTWCYYFVREQWSDPNWSDPDRDSSIYYGSGPSFGEIKLDGSLKTYDSPESMWLDCIARNARADADSLAYGFDYGGKKSVEDFRKNLEEYGGEGAPDQNDSDVDAQRPGTNPKSGSLTPQRKSR